MRTLDSLRRLAPALLAALTLCVSLASTVHSHAPASPRAEASAAAAPHAAAAPEADLDCALCAASARLGHGAVSTLAPAGITAPRPCAAQPARPLAPACAALSRSESRAPPRIG